MRSTGCCARTTDEFTSQPLCVGQTRSLPLACPARRAGGLSPAFPALVGQVAGAGEPGEHRDHDHRGAGDDPAGGAQPERQRVAGVERVAVAFLDAADLNTIASPASLLPGLSVMWELT
jgi:hypothetical protein